MDVSENRIYSIDIISIDSPAPALVASTANPIDGVEEGFTDEIVNNSFSQSIPTPQIFNQLMYLNVSSNYLFSLFGIQCCQQLKV